MLKSGHDNTYTTQLSCQNLNPQRTSCPLAQEDKIITHYLGKNKQILQDSVRTTSAVDLEEFCEKHYEKLLPIMADKYEYEKRKKEKLEEVKARLDFGDARKKSTRAQESAYSESRTISPRRQRRSRSPRRNPSVFTRLRLERSRSPRHEYKKKERRESTVFKRLGSRGRSTSAHSDSRQESSRYTENYSESEDSEGGHWKSKLRRKKSSVEDDDLSQPWVCAETDPFTSRIRHFDFPKTRMPSHVKTYNGSEDPEDHLKYIKHSNKRRGGHANNGVTMTMKERLRPEIKNQMVPATTLLIGFSSEIKWPLGQITLLVRIGDDEHSTSAWMDFMVVRSTSPHNGIIRMPSHVMGGTLTLRSSKIIPVACAMISGPEDQSPLVNKVKEERIKVAINPEHPEQTVMIGSDLTEKTRSKLCNLLQRSMDIFAWTPTDMTGVPRQIAEHKLNVPERLPAGRQQEKRPSRKRKCYNKHELVACDS
ncbi:hypothetical protein Tco_1165219 [Tanacetum coccineum]